MADNQKQYVFRLHGKGTSNVINNGWDWSEAINSTAIETIDDQTVSKIHDKITSIPSPFARLALAQQAFEYVVAQCRENGNLDGDTVYHKIVSACLDIGQIFFMYEVYKEKLKIYEWDIGKLQELEKSNNASHRQLARTLKLFSDNDEILKKFKFLIIEYTGRKRSAGFGNLVVGGTSPYTGFVASTEKQPEMDFIRFETIDGSIDKPLDDFSKPLYKRSKDYIKYLYWCSLQKEFRNYFSEENIAFRSYIEESKARVDDEEFKQELEDIKDKKLSYENINITPLEIEGKQIEMFPGFPVYILSRPANLQNFLEDCLIRTDLPMSAPKGTEKKDFYLLGDGKLASYFLPIKKEYFKYYPPSKLKEHLKADIDAQGFVKVKITLAPNVSYEHEYYKPTATEIIQGKFPIIDMEASSPIIFPHVRYSNDVRPEYRVAMLCGGHDDNARKGKYAEKMSLAFWKFPKKGSNEIKEADIDRKKQIKAKNFEGEDSSITPFVIHSIKDNFDFITLCADGKHSNVILPDFGKLDSGSGNKTFFFSIDFGTTNTQVDYSYTNDGEYGDIHSFSISREYAQYSNTEGLAHSDNGERAAPGLAADNIFMPYPGTCGQEDSKFSFPIRTALSCPKDIRFGYTTIEPFFDAWIPLTYEKSTQPKYNEKPTTGLKWDATQEGIEKTKAFLTSLAYIIRNKVLIEGGSLKDTRIIWFFPTSMEPVQIERISDVWKEIIKTYFGEDAKLFHMPESVAPWINIRNKSNRCINIDVGGGTTDFLFGEDKEVKFISSARFASNALFGRGLCDDNVSLNPENGVVSAFKSKAGKAIDDNKELLKNIPYSEIKNSSPEDLASFFFQLKDNDCLKNEPALQDKLDFQKWIKGNSSCVELILLFYYSLIYYVAKLLKSNNFAEPRYIYFSGNGSRIFNIFLESKARNAVITRITKRLIMGVFDKKEEEYDHNGLEILMHVGGKPKEATAAGGIIALRNKDYDVCMTESFAREKSMLWTGSDDTLVNVSEKKKIKGEDRKKLYAGTKSSIEDFVKKCKDALDGVDTASLLVSRGYGPDYFDKEIFRRDIEANASTGDKRNSSGDDGYLYSSLFFYPIEGILHSLAREVENQK